MNSACGTLDEVESFLHFAGNFWWLIFPLGGAIGGGIKAVAAANERRADRRLERYRIKQQTKVAVAEARGRAKVDDAALLRETNKLLAQHESTDEWWLDYEMDVAKLLDFPMMTDMREPLTVTFHRSRSDFSDEGRERIERAQRLLRLASDPAATPDERHNAYTRAQRELDGLAQLPAVTRLALERTIARELEA